MISSKLTNKLSSRAPLKRDVAISEIASQASPDRNDNSTRGFTLVELLIVLVVIGFFGSIVVNIITSTFRGTSKTDIINTVRQNGDYAISQMQKMIGYAKSFDGASTDGNPPWGCQLFPPPPAPTPIPVQYKAVKTTSFDGITTIFSCNGSSDTPPSTIVSNGVSLMNAGPSGLVLLSPGSCFFTCSRNSIADSPTIGIKFTLTSTITSGIAEKQATIPFETTIKVRN